MILEALLALLFKIKKEEEEGHWTELRLLPLYRLFWALCTLHTHLPFQRERTSEDPWKYLSTPLRNSDLVKYLFLLSTTFTKVPWLTMKQGFRGSLLKAKGSELYSSLMNKNTLVLGGTVFVLLKRAGHFLLTWTAVGGRCYESVTKCLQLPPSLKQWGRQGDGSPCVWKQQPDTNLLYTLRCIYSKIRRCLHHFWPPPPQHSLRIKVIKTKRGKQCVWTRACLEQRLVLPSPCGLRGFVSSLVLTVSLLITYLSVLFLRA